MATEKVLKIKVDAETKKALKGMKTLQSQTSKSTAGFKKMGGTIAKFVGAALVLKAFKDVTKAAIRQENSIKALNTALKLTGESFTQTQGGIDAMSANLQQVAADIQKVTTVGDEASMEVMQLGLSMGIQAGKIGEATKQAIGLSKAYKMDLNASIKMVALAHKGDFNMLQRYIPQLKLAKTTAEKKTIALKAMAGGYEIAKAEAETFGGKLTQLGNTFGDFKERVGAGITQSKSFGDAMSSVSDVLGDPAFTDGLAAIAGGLATFIATIVKAAAGLVKFGKDLGYFMTNLARAEDQLKSQEEQFNDILVSVQKFKRELGKTDDLRAFNVAMRKITASEDDAATKSNKLLKLIRETKKGNEELSDAWDKVRGEQEKSIIATVKNTTVMGANTEIVDRNTVSTNKNTTANKEYAKVLQLANPIQSSFKDIIESTIPPIKEETQTLEEFADQLDSDTTPATLFWETALGKLLGTLGQTFGALTRLGGPLGDIAGDFQNVAGDVGNLISGLGGGKFGLKDIPNAINLGISAFEALGSVLGSVGNAIGGFFDMWGDSEWKKLLRSTDEETNAIHDMINTLGMTPAVIDTIKNRLDTLPAGFEATRRGLEQLLIDAGAAEAGMRGLAGRPELEADAGSFKHQTDTPTFDKNSFNPDGGGGGFMSAANGFNGVLKRDTLIQAHAKEGVSITPKGQMGSGSSGGGDKIDARRYNFDNTFQFNLTESAILKIVANGFRKNREQLNRVAKESMGIG